MWRVDKHPHDKTIAEAIGDEGLLNAMLLSPYEGQERKAKLYSWSSGLGEH